MIWYFVVCARSHTEKALYCKYYAYPSVDKNILRTHMHAVCGREVSK